MVGFCRLADRLNLRLHDSPVGVTPLPIPSPHTWAELRVRVGESNALDAGFELVSVAEDLTTTIRLGSGEILAGKPGDYFAGPLAGTSRPQLVSASYQTAPPSPCASQLGLEGPAAYGWAFDQHTAGANSNARQAHQPAVAIPAPYRSVRAAAGRVRASGPLLLVRRPATSLRANEKSVSRLKA